MAISNLSLHSTNEVHKGRDSDGPLTLEDNQMLDDVLDPTIKKEEIEDPSTNQDKICFEEEEEEEEDEEDEEDAIEQITEGNSSKDHKKKRGKQSTTIKIIQQIRSLGGSPRSILDKLLAIEKTMEYFDKELRANEGSISEIDTSRKESTDDLLWEEQGSGLLPFIQKCLRNESAYSNVIRWTNKNDREFKIVDPDKFARMWGTEKRKEGMNKRKLTRSLGYLVNNKGKLKRSTSRTFVYSFVPRHGRAIHSPASSDVSSPRSSPVSTPQTSCSGLNTSFPQTQSQGPKKTVTAEQLEQLLQKNPKYRNICRKLKISLEQQRQQQLQQHQMRQQQKPEDQQREFQQNKVGEKRPSPFPPNYPEKKQPLLSPAPMNTMEEHIINQSSQPWQSFIKAPPPYNSNQLDSCNPRVLNTGDSSISMYNNGQSIPHSTNITKYLDILLNEPLTRVTEEDIMVKTDNTPIEFTQMQQPYDDDILSVNPTLTTHSSNEIAYLTSLYLDQPMEQS